MSCRFQLPIGVAELMHYFDAMHTSVNAPDNEQQGTATQIKKVETGAQAPAASAAADHKVTHFVPYNVCHATMPHQY